MATPDALLGACIVIATEPHFGIRLLGGCCTRVATDAGP
jgi:hypothetical protein